MTIALHLSRVAQAARRAIASIIEIPPGAEETTVIAHARDPDGYGIHQRHPAWSMSTPVKGRYAYPYRAAARRVCGFGARLYDVRHSLIMPGFDEPDDRRTLMEWVFARTFGLQLSDVPGIHAPPPYDIEHYHDGMTRDDLDARNDMLADKRRAFDASLDACGDFLRDVEVTRIALRFALHVIGASWKHKETIGELHDRHAGDLRSARVFFHPDRPMLSTEVLRFEMCFAQPFWPGLLEHAEVCNPHDELHRVPWTGDVVCTAALARAPDDRERALRQLARFPHAASKARKPVFL